MDEGYVRLLDRADDIAEFDGAFWRIVPCWSVEVEKVSIGHYSELMMCL
jgi:hypothetical protein